MTDNVENLSQCSFAFLQEEDRFKVQQLYSSVGLHNDDLGYDRFDVTYRFAFPLWYRDLQILNWGQFVYKDFSFAFNWRTFLLSNFFFISRQFIL